MKQTKKTTLRPPSQKTKQTLNEIKMMCFSRQKYRYLTDSSQFPLMGARVSNIKLGQGLPTITVKQNFYLAYDEGLGGDSYRDITIEVAIYTLPIYKRVVVVYATNKQKDSTCFETFCQQQGIKYVKLDEPSKDRKKTIQQFIGAMTTMDKLYQANHAEKGTKQCKV